MRTATLRLSVVAAVLLLGACGGGKRPPAIATGGPTAPVSSGSTGRSEPRPHPVDSGPDLASLANDGLSGSEYDISSESAGGPLADVLFGYDESNLSDSARQQVEQHASWLQTRRDTRVVIEGHCDERGTTEYNLALGEQRARAVRDYLVSLGVSEERLSIVSLGKERPLDPGHGEDAWARNRRAHFVVRR